MIAGLVDTNLLIGIYRKRREALYWLQQQSRLGVTITSWFEFIRDANGKIGRAKCLDIISEFELQLLTNDDQ